MYQTEARPWKYGDGPHSVPTMGGTLTDHCHMGQTSIPDNTEVEKRADSHENSEMKALGRHSDTEGGGREAAKTQGRW